jgi:glycosyltransferase involved in cell wall biosynthesis
MRIAYVCADRGIPLRGLKGASTHLREMAAALTSGGHEVVMACARIDGENPMPPVEEVAVLPEGGGEQDALLQTLLERRRVEVVLERYSLETGVARDVTARLGIPLVLEVNAPLVLEAARYRGLAGVEGALIRERQTLQTADAAVVVSTALGNYVRERAPGTRVEVVPNGVDSSRFAGHPPAELGLPSGAIVVGFVGSMKRWHGIGELLEAFRSVARVHPAAHLVFAGSGPEDDLVRSTGSELGMRGRVHALGPRPHDRIPGILAALSIGVAPYPKIEDFYFSPLKVMEYMAAGVPVVYSDLGDLSAIVDGAGIACPAGDVPALARAITDLARDTGLRWRLGAAGRQRSLAYSWERAAGAVERVLWSTVGKNRSKDAAP